MYEFKDAVRYAVTESVNPETISLPEITNAHRYITRSDVTLRKPLTLRQNISCCRQGSINLTYTKRFLVTELSVRYCGLLRRTKTELLRFYSLVMLKNKLLAIIISLSDVLKENIHDAVSLLICTSGTCVCTAQRVCELTDEDPTFSRVAV